MFSFFKGFKFNTHFLHSYKLYKCIKCINYKKFSYNSTQHKNFQTGNVPQLLLSLHFWRLLAGYFEVHFSCSVGSNSLRPRGLQHARLPCSSPTPRTYPNSCPSSRWCHPTISSSVVTFSSCLHSFPASGSFPMSQFFTSGGQSAELCWQSHVSAF